MRGLYVHIPYCVRKCSYCDFYSLPDRLETLDAYVQAVLQEALAHSSLSPLATNGRINNPPVSPLALSPAGRNTFDIKSKCTGRESERGGNSVCHSDPPQAEKNLVSPVCHSERSEESSPPVVGSGFKPDRPVAPHLSPECNKSNLLSHETGETGVRGDSTIRHCESAQADAATSGRGDYVCHSDLPQAEKNLVSPVCHSERSEESSSTIPLCSSPLKEDDSDCSPQGGTTSRMRTYEGLPPSTPKLSFQTIYIGGGTPSLLGPKHFNQLIDGLNDIFSLPRSSVGSGFKPDRLVAPHLSPEDNKSNLLSRETGETGVRGDSPLSPLATCGREPERGAYQSFNPLCSSPLEGEDSAEGFPKTNEIQSLLEATIEINPESAKPAFLEAVKNAGFNRLSFGVQSLNDHELCSVGRVHTAAQAVTAVKLARQYHFPAISADLMIGLPGQTWHSLRHSLQTLVELKLQHLSVYCLSLEEGTALANNPPPDLPSDDIQAQLFDRTVSYLRSCGFVHYEISNFALPGYECQHNLNYWHGGEYLGLGPAAASHLDGKRFKNRANLEAYLENPTAQIEYVEDLSKKEKAAEEAMLRLRLLEEGLDAAALTAKFGQENTAAIIARLNKLTKEGLLINAGSVYRLAPHRILTSNPIFARVLTDDD